MDNLTDEQWQQFERDGYIKLGKVLTDDELAALQQRIDDIMLGKADVDYDRMMMQLDGTTGDYADVGDQTKGHKGATLDYRKIEQLEFDPLFLAYMQRPLFRNICARTYGADTAIRCFRAMFFNKPANRGSHLPWHQDRWTHLDRDPQITLWLALDPSTRESGCVQIVPGSHKNLINPDHPSGFMTEEQVGELLATNESVYLELQEGELALLHNWLVHSSEVNRAAHARRAFSICYMDSETQLCDDTFTDISQFPVIFGEGALEVDRLKAEG